MLGGGSRNVRQIGSTGSLSWISYQAHRNALAHKFKCRGKASADVQISLSGRFELARVVITKISRQVDLPWYLNPCDHATSWASFSVSSKMKKKILHQSEGRAVRSFVLFFVSATGGNAKNHTKKNPTHTLIAGSIIPEIIVHHVL